MKYYSLNRINEKNARYNLIVGERSNGKSYSVWEQGIRDYAEHGNQMAVIRRESEDFRGKRGAEMCSALVEDGLINKYTKGEWQNVFYKSQRWYFSRYDSEEDKRIISDEPFAYGFSLTASEHDKSTSYPKIKTVLFDEFITRNRYLPDEFVLFMNVVSTIVRQRKDVKIYMLGNTVNKYCPYFNEMGLKHVQEMKQGDIDIYTYGDSDLVVAVEYCKPNKEGKESDLYFAFDNPKLKMITGGEWELDIYPHCPYKYKPRDVVFNYFIEFDGNLLHCEIVVLGRNSFTFIHEKTTPIKDEDNDIVYTPNYDFRNNYRRNIKKPNDIIGKKIYNYFLTDKIFYQSNEIGEVVRNYLLWCTTN